MPLMLKREYDALVAANGDTPKKPAGEPERAPVVSEEEVEKTVNNSADATDDTHIVSARLVGSKRHKEARARLKHGTSLHLRRDEANKHDPNAIAVDVTAGFLPIHAGFVKGTQAESLAPALDSGALTVVACTVDAPNGVDALPTADVPVRLTLRRRDDDDASATSALELLKCPFDVPSSGRVRVPGHPRERVRRADAHSPVAHAPRVHQTLRLRRAEPRDQSTDGQSMGLRDGRQAV
jgi:hypothetical protein